jgi:hypothetical protein
MATLALFLLFGLPPPRPVAVVSGAEWLSPEGREQIARCVLIVPVDRTGAPLWMPRVD